MNLEKKQIGKGKYSMWALDGKIINGLEFHYFCQTEKTRPTKLTKAQIKKFLQQLGE